MLISRYVTIFAIPLVWLLSYLDFLPITLTESIIGSLFGYSFLYAIAKIFTWFTGKEGMGQGDFELLAFIGAFIGPLGCWITLLIGSTCGSLLGLTYLAIYKPSASVRIPFGPFLALGAILYTLLQLYFIALLTVH